MCDKSTGKVFLDWSPLSVTVDIFLGMNMDLPSCIYGIYVCLGVTGYLGRYGRVTGKGAWRKEERGVASKVRRLRGKRPATR